MTSESKLRIRIHKGDFEVELEGEEEYVKGEYRQLMDKLNSTSLQMPGVPVPKKSSANSTEVKTTSITRDSFFEKVQKLRDEGFFSEPKGSGEVTSELKVRGWGVYEGKNVSSLLKRYASKLELRRMEKGKNRYLYTFP